MNTAARLPLTAKRGTGSRFRSIILQADGAARWGRMTPSEWPGGSEEVATVLGQTGEALHDVTVSRVRLAETESSFLYLPPPEADWTALELADRTLILDQIQSLVRTCPLTAPPTKGREELEVTYCAAAVPRAQDPGEAILGCSRGF